MGSENRGVVAAADVLLRAARPTVLVSFATDDVRDLLVEFRPFVVRQKRPVLVLRWPLQRLVGVPRPDPLQIRLAPGGHQPASRRRVRIDRHPREFQEQDDNHEDAATLSTSNTFCSS
jgi:hypothetical protein